MDTTLQSIIEIALQQGIWAALCIYLLFRMLKENAACETQYQQMIDHLRMGREKSSKSVGLSNILDTIGREGIIGRKPL